MLVVQKLRLFLNGIRCRIKNLGALFLNVNKYLQLTKFIDNT